MTDTTPLSPRQVSALLAVAAHELTWGIPAVARELDGWRRRASAIPAAPLRQDAIGALASKRFNPEGAALFAVLAGTRNADLVRLLVAFQVLLDYLDSATERAVPDPLASARQLHLALVEALEPGAPMSDYYRFHPWRDDGGYLRALVGTCRACCTDLPAYARVQPFARRGALRCGVQGLNHIPDPILREAALRAWAGAEFPGARETSWWELTAAASSTLGVHALLAMAGDPTCSEAELTAVEAAYMPWICAASTMLDSYVDHLADLACGGHSYVAHYPSSRAAAQRVHELVRRSMIEAGRLRRGRRHLLIVAGMVAMYLSSDDARAPSMRPSTARLIQAGGSLTRLLVPLLRTWRIACSQRSP